MFKYFKYIHTSIPQTLKWIEYSITFFFRIGPRNTQLKPTANLNTFPLGNSPHECIFSMICNALTTVWCCFQIKGVDWSSNSLHYIGLVSLGCEFYLAECRPDPFEDRRAKNVVWWTRHWIAKFEQKPTTMYNFNHWTNIFYCNRFEGKEPRQFVFPTSDFRDHVSYFFVVNMSSFFTATNSTN